MGHIGKLSRGLKWWKNNRDLDGNILPVILADVDKMLDVNYYLDYTKNLDKAKVDLALYQMFLLRQAAGGVRSKLFRDLKEKLNDPNFGVKETKSKVKK